MQSKNMKVLGKNYSTIWLKEEDDEVISIIDQRYLPHRFIIEDLHSVSEIVHAIKDMHVRGAGLIGAAAGYGMYLATIEASHKNSLEHVLASAGALKATLTQLLSIWNGQSTSNYMLLPREKQPVKKLKSREKWLFLLLRKMREYCRRIGIDGAANYRRNQ